MNIDVPMIDSEVIVIDDEVIIIDDNTPSKKRKNNSLLVSNKKIIKTKNTKKSIPSTVKRLVWNKWIGEKIGKSKCLCCKVTYITQLSFHAGHIISEFNGGKINISNLKPICQNCNSSMGTKNMTQFMKSLK